MAAPRRVRTSLAVIATVALVGVAALSTSGTDPAAARSSPAGHLGAGDVVDLLPLHSDGERIVDSDGRQVILRGANVNSLGEYWQGLPAVSPTVPLTSADWDSMAAHGFSVVRLIMSWSRLEPTEGVIDGSYLDLLDAAVRSAAEHGIYTVLDMHQDAYTAFVSTADPAACPSGTSPARGWDGAPAWAVDTGGLSTCLTGGDRNSSPAVTHAWNSFYDDVGGVRTRFSSAWGAVAERFAGRPEVAGYDLLNEPEVSRPAGSLQAAYDDLVGDTVRAIRTGEAGADFEHLVFVEPAIPAADPGRGIVIPDPSGAGVDASQIVAAPHNYAESIVAGITIETFNDLFASVAAGLHVPVWIGEYGFWDTGPATLDKARRYAADEDRRAWGGAWWQWRQSCGDPHSVHWSGDQVVGNAGPQVHLNILGCPGNVDLGPNEDFLRILGRAYPRAVPGHVDELTSDPATGQMSVRATAGAAGGELVVWAPTADDAGHRVSVEGLVDVRQEPVPGGRVITARVAAAGAYGLSIGPGGPSTTPAPTTTAIPTGGTASTTSPAPPPRPAGRPARPVPGRPTYTG